MNLATHLIPPEHVLECLPALDSHVTSSLLLIFPPLFISYVGTSVTIISRLDFTETGQVSFHLAVYESVSQQFWNVPSPITYRFAANGKIKQLGLDLVLDVNRIKWIRQSVCVQTVVGWWCAGLCPAKWLDALMDWCLWNHIQCPEACCLILPTKSKFDWFISHCLTDLIQKWQIIEIIN